MTTFVNLTPHPLTILDAADFAHVYEPSGIIARVSSKDEVIGVIDGIEIFKTTFGAVEGVPDEKPNVYYVVSRLVAAALPGRNDILVPGQLIRDEQGRVIGARGFARI